MKIYYAESSVDVEEVIDRLKSLSLGYAIKVKREIEVFFIEDGGEQYVGKRQIMDHLEKVEGELAEWYYCGC